jgi:hypothetical protein
MVIGVVLALFTARGSIQAEQGASTPGQFAASLKWNESSRGPLLYLSNRPLQVKDNPQIEGGFATFASGSLHVIAPAQMTVIDPDYKQSPNTYDGLPRNEKVLYLASTFTKSQFEEACNKGIGLSSMTQEQQAVYRSILPSEFKYQTTSVWNPNDRSSAPPATTQITLTPDEESQVLLKFYKQMTLGVRLGTNGSFSAISAQDWDRHKPGTKLSTRIDSATEDKNSAFGIEIRKSYPNQAKPSDLNYKSSSYDMAFPLTPSSTVKEICQKASELIHRTIISDARFQNEVVTTLGTSARCGDVLKGLALCLTGTYRQVGETYVLTSDLEGIGTKMTKLGYWHWNLNQLVRKESENWKGKMAANQAIQSIGYASDDALTPNEAMRKFMDTDFEQGEKTMPASLLTPAWSQLLNSKDNHFGEPLRTDVAEPWDSAFWCFVAPGNETLRWESELDDMNAFTHYAERHRGGGPAQEQKIIDLASVPGAALVYQTDDADLASNLPRVARAQGFTEVWLQTTQSQALAAATEAGKVTGIAVKIVVEPFTAMGAHRNDPLDRTILGDPFSQGQSLVNGSEWVLSSNEMFSANERLVNFLNPTSANLAEYWKLLANLSRKPDLSGTVLLSGTPEGYEQRSEWAEYEPPQMAAPLSLGYTMDLREKFLLANSVDPVDLLEVRDQFDLQSLEQSISSFGELNNYTYGKVAETPPSFRDKWDKFRSEANEEQLNKFESLFPNTILVEWRRKIHDTSRNWDSVVSMHTDDPAEQTMDDDPYVKKIPTDAYYLQIVGFPLSEGAVNHMRRHLGIRIKKQATKFAIDLRAVPPDQLERTLKLLFASKPVKQ